MNRPASPLDPGPTSGASRYEMLATIASGGMATVYVGRLRGKGGFSRTVAVKRAHPHLLQDPTYRAMLVDEARLAAKLHHPNVVAVLDVEELEGELSLVMDYVEGASLMDLMDACAAAGQPLPPRIAVRVSLDAAAGLHAAHTLTDEFGQPLGLVHRDVSPHNILVGLDGVGRLSDFGIAKHAEGAGTATGVLKGKLSYMAPEYLEQTRLDSRSDVFSLGVVVWEALAGQKLFRGKSELETFKNVVATKVPPLSSIAGWASERLDEILFYALARDPESRYQTAEDFAIALETEARYDDLIATTAEVGACVRQLFGGALEERRAEVRRNAAPISLDRADVTARASAPGIGSSSGSWSGPAAAASARASGPGSGPVSAGGMRDSGAGVRDSVAARSQAPTMVARPPTPVPMGGDPPYPPARPVPIAPVSMASAPVEVPIETSRLQRRAQPPPEPADLGQAPASTGDADLRIPTSSGWVWKGALLLVVLAAVGGAVVYATRSGGEAQAPAAPSSTPTAGTVAAAPVTPPPAATTAAPAPHNTSISVTDLPDAKLAPLGSAHKPGKMPTKKGASSASPVSPGVPLSAWQPSQAPPPDMPAPVPEQPAVPPPGPGDPF